MSSLEIPLLSVELWSMVVSSIHDDDMCTFAKLRCVNKNLLAIVDDHLNRKYRMCLGGRKNPLQEWALMRFFTRSHWEFENAGRLVVGAWVPEYNHEQSYMLTDHFAEQCMLRCVFIERSYLTRNEYGNLLWWFPTHGQGIQFQTRCRFDQLAKLTMLNIAHHSRDIVVWQKDVLDLFIELLMMIDHIIWSLASIEGLQTRVCLDEPPPMYRRNRRTKPVRYGKINQLLDSLSTRLELPLVKFISTVKALAN